MKLKIYSVFFMLFLLSANMVFGQIDLDEPFDKGLEYDWDRQVLDERIQAELYELEINVIGTVAPLTTERKMLPQIIKTDEIEPDFEKLLNYSDSELLKMNYFGLSTKKSNMADGTGPVKGANYIKMYINNDSVISGSKADYIYMRFGKGHYIKLLNYHGSFPQGYILTWDLNNFISSIPQDRWDQISLETVSTDGIKINRLIIVHSGQEILDWNVNTWLDKWNGTFLGLGAKILERKLDWINNSDNASVFYGAQEIGKTDGDKYGTSGAWCSEFASWCLRKSGVLTPTGSIGTADMKAWFSIRGRAYNRSAIKNKNYIMVEGDYLSLFNGNHSAVFMYWIDSTSTITDETRFKTIEGNCSGTVKVVTRKVGDIDRVGRTK